MGREFSKSFERARGGKYGLKGLEWVMVYKSVQDTLDLNSGWRSSWFRAREVLLEGLRAKSLAEALISEKIVSKSYSGE